MDTETLVCDPFGFVLAPDDAAEYAAWLDAQRVERQAERELIEADYDTLPTGFDPFA